MKRNEKTTGPTEGAKLPSVDFRHEDMDSDDANLKSKSLLDEGLYYSKAVKNLGGTMITQGPYADGFPRGAVIHSTAGRPNTGEDSVRMAIKEATNAYFVIGRGGKVFQNFPLNRWGRHAGTTVHTTLGSDVSRKCIGIEVVAAGWLIKIDDNRFRPWYNDPKKNPRTPGLPKLADDFPASEVRYRTQIGVPREFGFQSAGYYHKFTAEQEASLIDLLRWLQNQKPHVFKFDNVVGHDEVAVYDDMVTRGRKNDPGGALSVTMREFRQRLKEGALNLMELR